MTRHRHISSIQKLALGTLKFLVLAFGTLASIALFCSCRSSDIATHESSVQNRMQETISQDSNPVLMFSVPYCLLFVGCKVCASRVQSRYRHCRLARPRTYSNFAEAQPDFTVFDGKGTQKTRNYSDNNFGFSFTFCRKGTILTNNQQ